jgi:hypothetical protein
VPKNGGNDNQKGHAFLLAFDMRHGIPLGVKAEMNSVGEMQIQKNNYGQAIDWSNQKNAIYVVDRGFMDGAYWQERKINNGATVITRFKSTLKFTEIAPRTIAKKVCNENVVSDVEITLSCANAATWRLIQWRAPSRMLMQYLTNDLHLEPGVVAFLYFRRWDEEKYFDTFKNDLAGAKAWGKKPAALDQQCLMGVITTLLTRMFLHKQCAVLDLNKEDGTQDKRYAKRQDRYLEIKVMRSSTTSNEVDASSIDDEDPPEVNTYYDAYRAFYAIPSKISRQVWRFLKDCYFQKNTIDLYWLKLKPIMESYL